MPLPAAAPKFLPPQSRCAVFFFVIRHHRKRKEKEQRGTKKQRTATKNKRKVRLPENDVGHNVENHLNQSESEEEVEEPDDEMGESNAAGAAIAGTATAATATRKGPALAAEGEGAPLRPPGAKKRKICCSVCRKTGHQKPKCPDLEYADAETPKPTLNVVEGQVIRCWDIESDASTKVVYEAGSCLTKSTNHRWHDLPGGAENGATPHGGEPVV